MSDAGVQIFSLTDLLERLAANDNARTVQIYAGHYTGQGQQITMLLLQRKEGEPWPAAKVKEINKLRGNFTAHFKPGNEFMYVTSDHAGNYSNYQFPMNGDDFLTPYHGKDIQALVKDILRLERENIELQARVKELSGELSYYNDNRNKFVDALEMFAGRLVPKFAPELASFFGNGNSQPIQGTNNMAQWQNIDVSGNQPQHVENALEVLLSAFGEDNLLKFARMIQRDPSKVQMLTNFL